MSTADIDAELRQLGARRERLTDRIHQALLDIAAIDYRQDVLLTRRHAEQLQHDIGQRITPPL